MARADEQTSRDNADTMLWPTSPRAGISSPFGPRGGRMHEGVDISVGSGSAAIAPLDGTMTNLDDPDGYGWYSIINHGNGISTLFGHLRSRKGPGQVRRGETIGETGGGASDPHKGNAQGAHLHFEVHVNGTPVDPEPYISGGQVVEGGELGGGAGGGGVTANLDQILTAAKAAAFATNLQFPGVEERNEAFALQGQKSLLNDQPLFDFIKQLAGACLRDFQSLPNGDFYAFYPNYFGTYQSRDPYWNVYDIELTEGTIDLTDDTLATHVYVVGDTIGYDGTIDSTERVLTSGAVTIHNVAQPGFQKGKPASKKQDEDDQDNVEKETEELMKALFMTDPGQVVDFLGRYGARPHYEEATNVRNPMYEAFLAYQRFQLLWSEQFATTFKFTFMPELYPSGIIAFPNHNLQCYVQEVTHNFNYESGFTTNAILMAPAAIGKDKNEEDPLKFGLVPANTADIGKD